MEVFKNVKEAYKNLREVERRKIVDYLKLNGFKTQNGNELSYRGGSGRPAYTSGGEIVEYDLSNWKWVEASKENVTYFISLQAFDSDPKSGNHHVLMDRIGVCAFDENIKEEDKNYFQDMVRTTLDLPLDETKIEMFPEILEDARLDMLKKVKSEMQKN